MPRSMCLRQLLDYWAILVDFWFFFFIFFSHVEPDSGLRQSRSTEFSTDLAILIANLQWDLPVEPHPADTVFGV